MDTYKLPYAGPEALRLDPGALLRFMQALEQEALEPHCLVVLRHGKVACEAYWQPYGTEHPHALNSLTKSFVSMAAGFAVDEGLLSLDDPITEHLQLSPALSARYPDVTIRHLLTMSTGHTADSNVRIFSSGFLSSRWTGEAMGDGWIEESLSIRQTAMPGERFYYCNRGPYLLSVILQKVTGQKISEYLQPRLFDPLGIAPPFWAEGPAGHSRGGSGLRLRAMDTAKFGQMLLNGGQFGGRQVVPKAWVSAATIKQIDNNLHGNTDSDWSQGYGYYFWMCRHGAFRGDGAYGQYCIVLPEQDAVVVLYSGRREHDNMQDALNLVWRHLLPGMDGDGQSASEADLRDTLRGLTLAKPSAPGQGQSLSRAYKVHYNWDNVRALSLTVDGAACCLRWRDDRGDHALHAGMNAYGPVGVLDGEAYVAHGAWNGAQTLLLDVYWVETPYHAHLTLHMEADDIHIAEKCHGFLIKEAAYHGVRIDCGI